MDGQAERSHDHLTTTIERVGTERRWAARAAATRALVQSADMADASMKVMEAVGECLGWRFGALWRIDPRGPVLRCVEVWQARGFDGREFEEATRRSAFPPGVGLPGRVWQSGRPVWIPDVLKDDNFPRAAAAARAGLHGALSFPIARLGRLLGVVDFLSHRIEPPDDDLLDMMAGLGAQIGQSFACAEAEAEVRRIEAHQSAILDSALDCFIAMDHEGRIIEFNRMAEKTFGFPRDEVIGRSLAETIVPPELREAHRDGLERYLRTGESPLLGTRVETTAIRRDRTRFPVELALTRIGAARPPAFVASLRDITDRKSAEEALRESEERHRLLFECSPHPMWVFDAETSRFLAVNETAVRRYGWSREEFLSMTIDEIRPPGEAGALPEEVSGANQTGAGATYKHRTKDGRVLDVEVAAQPFVFGGRRARVVMAIDVTEQKKTEDQLRWSQRMESVGRLAGGVAHDFNNLLTAINGYSQLLLMRLEPDSPLNQEAAEIQKATDRAAALTRQLLAFGRRQELRPRVLSLNTTVMEVERMLRRLIGEDIEMTVSLHPELLRTRVDPGQIEQVFMNLAVNARDAMPSGGRLAIETRNVDLDEAYTARHVGVRPGVYVMLSTTDTGCGMDKETQSRIFEPFFTTKEEGKGTGLGLAMVYGIVKQSGGNIWVYSGPGKGSTFKIYLPAVTGRIEETTPSRSDQVEPLRGSETILIVEDEEMVRKMVCRTLEKNGYEVMEASLGEEALKISASHDGPVHLLVADVIIPQMSVTELVARLRLQRPGMKVMYMSGYAGSVVAQYGVPREEGVFLEKPFTPEALARKVRELLGR